MKKLANDPWEGIEKKYKVGQKVEGAVIKVNPFGLFVELEKNIQGLAHISQLNEKQAANIGEVAKVGENKEFYVVSIDPKNHRLGLSLIKPKAEKETKAEIAEVSGDSKENTSSEEAPKEEKKRGRKKKEEAAETIATETEAEPLKQAE